MQLKRLMIMINDKNLDSSMIIMYTVSMLRNGSQW